MPDDKARAATEEVADYQGELTKPRGELGEPFEETGERIGRVEVEVRPLVLAFQGANFFLQLRWVRSF